MKHIPISARLWASLCHLTITIWTLIFSKFSFDDELFDLLPSGASMCGFKPNPICEDPNVLFVLMLVTLIRLILLWSPQFIVALITLSLWRIKRNNHDFINKHGQEAFSFQFKWAKYTIFINLIVFILIIPPLFPLNTLIHLIPLRLVHLYYLNLIFVLPLFFIQVLWASILTVVALKGSFIRYGDICNHQVGAKS